MGRGGERGREKEKRERNSKLPKFWCCFLRLNFMSHKVLWIKENTDIFSAQVPEYCFKEGALHATTSKQEKSLL